MAKFKKLIEDALSDKRQRKSAKYVTRRLRDYIDRYGKEAFEEAIGGYRYKISGTEFLPDRGSLPDFVPGAFHPFDFRVYVVTPERSDGSAYYSKERRAGNTYRTINLPYIGKDGDMGRIADKVAANEKTIIHELIHLFDDLRITKDLSGIIQADPEDYKGQGEAYFNDPVELNAYFQEAIGDFEEFIERSPETLAALSDQMKDFRSFKEFAFDQLFRDSFIRNLTDENRERITKRLYKFYQDFKNTNLFQKQVAR